MHSRVRAYVHVMRTSAAVGRRRTWSNDFNDLTDLNDLSGLGGLGVANQATAGGTWTA